jgi:hypothetical protein
MTSPSILGAAQEHIEGRTVRDIVEYSPGEVNEVWCRKIFRQLLQSLELQYAMRMPHRPITPDTIVFHDNGEPLLVPSPGEPTQGLEADDLTALARVVHYAITQELAPMGPLSGRAGLDGYSASLLAAVDRCMAPDPAERPRTVDALRDLLGIVPLGPAAAPAAMFAQPDLPPPRLHQASAIDLPAFAPATAVPHRFTGLSRWQRWAIAAGGAALLLALAVALVAELRDTGSFDRVVLTLPQAADSATGTAAAPAPAPTPGAGAPAPAAAVAASATPAAGVAYKLLIQPWGVVYVDDVDCGVSPPVKRLVLAPGKHTVRVSNPNFHDRVLEIDTAAGDASIVVDFDAHTRK